MLLWRYGLGCISLPDDDQAGPSHHSMVKKVPLYGEMRQTTAPVAQGYWSQKESPYRAMLQGEPFTLLIVLRR